MFTCKTNFKIEMFVVYFLLTVPYKCAFCVLNDRMTEYVNNYATAIYSNTIS